ncbi:hypothetical protein PPL_11730 [Heterostelium album PN500]|uniref:Uncharacterized protein n=1 Tax=Heterostelium pallidum (strain ATCC 26659 / Pp 5 / PN500) TaxID=670386 RepID=D3BUB1_HETP5|nr:hypothetical protein PPL_11730 [Heterostelium album PN500]EFA75045.1 hypothetical protein PPL_11730 [Heterostelium album PN500]|eukprot:XP_020427179.1 hypothetical protein PPL_11730 [Heterostelium album PN500]
MQLHQLSYILLKNILKYLDKNIDRICLVLICKRLFDNRDQFLYFDQPLPTLYRFDQKCCLQSFKQQIRRSIENKSYTTAYYLNTTKESFLSTNTKNDDNNNENIENDKDNSSELNNLMLKYDFVMFGKEKDYLDKIDSYPFSLQELTLNETVKKQGFLKFNYRKKETKSRLPQTIRSLRLGNYYNQSTPPGAIPFGVKELALGETFYQHLTAGSIPESVEKLEHGRYLFSITVPPSVKEIHYPCGLASSDFFLNLMSVQKYQVQLSTDCNLTLYRERQNPTVFITLDDHLTKGLFLTLKQLKKLIDKHRSPIITSP